MPARPKNRWRRAVERLASEIPRKRLHPDVVRWAEANGDGPWAVAFSGGADSLALLLVVWAHWPECRRTLRVLHFNHGLRGRASDADERFCRDVCAALGARLRAGRWQNANAEASEAEARAARLEFFRMEMAKAGARALWTGHQQDDVAETMLMRIARGSGSSGLAAPRPVQRWADGRAHLRPMLTLSKCEIEAMLRAAGARWRSDATNAGRAFLRNRMRHDVVPVWRAAVAGRDAVAGAALARQLIQEDDEALEGWLDELDVLGKNGELRLGRVKGKPRGLVRRAVQRWLAHHGRAGEVSRQALDALVDDVGRGRVTRHSLGTNVFAEVGRKAVRFVTNAEKSRGNSKVAPIDL